jgi:hypothetical protein
MSNRIDHGYSVARDSDAFTQRLTGDKLLKAQERLAFGLVRRNSLLPWIEPQSGVGPAHFPPDLQSLMVAAKTKTHEEIVAIVASQPDGKIARAYRKGIELVHGEALVLAKQIVLSVTPGQANCRDSQPSQDEVMEPPSEQAASNHLVRHINGIPGTASPKKTVTKTVEPKTEGARKAAEDSQEPPRPLMRELPAPDPFPVDALGVLAPAARAIHDRVRAPIAICGQSVLAVATLAVQGHGNIELPMGHTKPVSDFFVSIGVTGERKSGVDYEALGAVRKREAGLREAHRKEHLEYENEKNAWEAARKKAISGGKGDVPQSPPHLRR